MPDDAKPAAAPKPEDDRITGSAWQDFTRGKGVGTLNQVDPPSWATPACGSRR